MNRFIIRGMMYGCTAFLAWAMPIGAESIVYPANAGIINVVKDKGVDNTGATDVTDTLNKIMLGTVGWRVIYFPDGTYRVTGPVSAFVCPGSEVVRGPIVQGQSRERTIIRLDNGIWPTVLASTATTGERRGRVVLNLGECGNRSFNKGLHNIRVDIGSNNAGAIGVRFNSSNNGCMSNVDIISGDGAGMIGLDLGGQENGNGLAHDVYVRGFAVGVQGEASLSYTLSKITLENQSQYGILNKWRTYIDGLVSTNTVPAVKNDRNLLLINAQLNGGNGGSAIENSGSMLFARNIATSGYQKAIASTAPQTAPTGTTIAEYSSHGSAGLFHTPGVSMNLEVKYPPYPAWETDTAKWANVQSYKGCRIGQPCKTDQDAFALALAASGKTAILVPGDKSLSLTDTLYVRGAIARVAGTGAGISGGVLVVEDGTAPVVMLQQMSGITVVVRTSRTVILESMVSCRTYGGGTGDLFINDHMAQYFCTNPNQRAWIRQLNLEYESVCGSGRYDCCLTDFSMGCTWILGFKSEESYCKASISGGFLEILGMLEYSLNNNHPTGLALYEITGGQFSAAMTTQIYHGSATPFDYLVDETRNSEQRYLMRSTNGQELPLYTGYNPSGPFPSGARNPAVAQKTGPTGLSVRCLPSGILKVRMTGQDHSPVTVRLIDIHGRSVTLGAPMVGSTSDCAYYDLGDRAAGMYVARIVTHDGSSRATGVMIAR